MNINKRVLEEIQNITPSDATPKKRRVSLGFEMVSVLCDSPKKLSMDVPTSPDPGPAPSSRIPAPPSHPSASMNEISEQNSKKATGIPKSKAVVESTPEIDLLHVKRLVKYNKSLKSDASNAHPPTSSNFNSDSLRSRMTKLESTYSNDINSLQESSKVLAGQINSSLETSQSLQTDLLELKREMKKLSNHISTAELSIVSKRKQFEILEDQIMKNVHHREKLVNIQIEQLLNDLRDSLEELDFQMQEEKKVARNFKEPETMEEIRKLNRNCETLQIQLDETANRKQQVIKQELSELDRKLDHFLKEKSAKSKVLGEKYESNQKLLEEQVLNKYKILKRQVEEKELELNRIKATISDSETIIGKYSHAKEQMSSKKKILQDNMNVANIERKEWEAKLGQARKSHDDAYERYELQQNSIMKLENSIWDYEGKLRVFVSDTDGRNSGQNEHLFNAYSFNKMFSSDQRLISIAYISSVVESVLLGNNCSVLVSGMEQSEFLKEVISKNYNDIERKSKSFIGWNYSLQLNENLSFSESQSFNQHTSSVENLLQSSNSKCYTLTVSATGPGGATWKAAVFYLDVSSLPYLRQCNILREPLLPSFQTINSNPSSTFSQTKLVNFMYNKTKFLNVSSVPTEEENAKQILEVCDMLNSSKSAYKAKNCFSLS